MTNDQPSNTQKVASRRQLVVEDWRLFGLWRLDIGASPCGWKSMEEKI
jgi:hypothetical protein